MSKLVQLCKCKVGAVKVIHKIRNIYLLLKVNKIVLFPPSKVDRAMRKEDTSAQGKIVTEILQHLHACKKSVEVFYGRVEELEQLKDYITGSACY